MVSLTATSPPKSKEDTGPSLDRPGLVPKIMASVLLEFNISPLSINQNVRAVTHFESASPPSRLNPRISPPCRVGYRRRTDDT